MRSIAFLSQKGGSGKTTLAVHIAVAAEASGEQVIMMQRAEQDRAPLDLLIVLTEPAPHCMTAMPGGVVLDQADTDLGGQRQGPSARWLAERPRTLVQQRSEGLAGPGIDDR